MSQDLSTDILSQIIIYMKYSKFLPDKQRRETWEEIVDRNMQMHIRRYPKIKLEIEEAFQFVKDKKVLPSMRTLQFSGKPIEISPNRAYNCSYLPVDSWESFHETMFLLLGGSGVGFSVQKQHISKLPIIKKPTKRKRRYLIADSIEGWSDTIKVLMRAYFNGESDPDFDYSDIRAKGTLLKTSGGKAPGPQPLKDAVYNIRKILDLKEQDSKLTPLEAHDIMCFIANAVLSGGIRRSAMISFFSLDDLEMLECKFGNWYELNPQRARANNSAVVLRHKIKKAQFKDLWKKVRASGSGEPGIFFSNNSDMLGNPCQPEWATVLTPQGIKQFKDIGIGSIIWSGKQWTKVTKKWSTGIKPVNAYRTTAGVFYGTENHRVVSHGEKIEVQYAESIDVCTGQLLSETNILNPQDIMDGLVIGDGSVHEASSNLVYLCVGTNDYDYHNDEDVKSLFRVKRPGLGDYAWKIDTTISNVELPKTYERSVPERFRLNASSDVIRGFLRGLYSANGSVVRNRVTLKASSKTVIIQVQEMLSAIGIKSYYTTNKSKDVVFENGEYTCRESYDLNISTDRNKFAELIGFIQKYKTEKLTNILKVNSTRTKTTYDIVSVDHISTEEVFDLTVEADEHTYWTGGLLVSNCVEVSLRAFQFCNLCSINTLDIKDQIDFNTRAKAAAFIGTLQAGYTNFHYLRDIWRETTEKEALLGVSLAGVASGTVLKLNLTKAAKIIKNENRRVAKLIGINPAARLTCEKPDGTTSLVLGCSSGAHAWHSEYYMRRVTVNKAESIYTYLANKLPDLVEDDLFRPELEAKIMVPIKAPQQALFRTEPASALLSRVKLLSETWIKPGHVSGQNTHNVSATISVKDDEWDSVGEWMWANRKHYNGLSVLPMDLGTYVQAPHEEITKEQYEALLPKLKEIHLSKIKEFQDTTDLKGEVACGPNGACEVT
jgi:hypothetical protein